jgi:hypothetical protein
MTKAGSVRASPSGAQGQQPYNDHGVLGTSSAAGVSSRNAPANDNAGDHDLLPCLPVTDDEVTLLHRYLSREILGLFS